jgi:hypothetical protein
MSFNLREIFGSKPRYLYTFARGDTMWRVCSDGAPVTVVASGMTYDPALITHGRMERNAEFNLVTGESRLNEPFPTKLIERQTQWAAFSAESGVDEADFSFDTTITDIDRGIISVASIDGNDEPYYNLGQLKFGAGATAERVFVNYHVGTEFHIAGRLPAGVIVGSDVTLVAGNDGMLKTAIDKFGPDAVDRFLGFDLLPSTDPLVTGLLR